MSKTNVFGKKQKTLVDNEVQALSFDLWHLLGCEILAARFSSHVYHDIKLLFLYITK